MKDQNWILYVSTYPPRECGIATFTRDLTKSMDKRFNPTLKSKILAINDNGSSMYNYVSKVKMQLNESYIEKYIDVAKKINNDKRIKLVSIQHEFGIFGGNYGDYIIPFLDTLKKPVVVTFHSVLPKPDPDRLRIVKAIAKRSSAITVMANSAVDILTEDYGIERKKINVIHHGVPMFHPNRKDKIKKKIGLENHFIISTFGLINKGKGIEYTIRAMLKVVKKHPNALFLVIGETHPQVRKNDGEDYRNKLLSMVKEFKLQDHVKFYNKYLTLQEIIWYLEATDIYVNAALDPNQITSGTVAYALGAGKAIISTPSLYGKEMIEDEKGILVDFKDSNGIASAINKMIENPKFRRKIEKNAYKFGTKMQWSNVASDYLNTFKKIINVKESVGLHKFPKFKLTHLLSLTDDTGVIQHAKHSISNRETGYALDDNARALIVAIKSYTLFRDAQSFELTKKYLSFIQYCQRKDGMFHNSVGYDRRFIDETGSEDSYGRSLWAVGCVISSKIYENIKATAKFIFDNAIENYKKINSLRGKAFTIHGLYNYYTVYKNKDIKEKVKYLADFLVRKYKQNKSEGWRWFENSVTYSNGIIPSSLFLAYEMLGDKKYLEVGKESLDFLSNLVIIDNKLVLIGHNGWYLKNGERSFHDQQPVDAASMVYAYKIAYNITKENKYYQNSLIAFHWFLGKNSINQVVYDEVTGGCFDGLLPNCLNLNQGAESTISYLIARLNVEEMKRNK